MMQIDTDRIRMRIKTVADDHIDQAITAQQNGSSQTRRCVTMESNRWDK